AFVVLGVALVTLARGRGTPWPVWFARLSGLLVLLYATVRLCELVIGRDLGTEHWFFYPPRGSFGLASPSQMPFISAVNFWFTAATLLLLISPLKKHPADRRLRLLGLILDLLVLAMSLVFALGYLFGDPFFQGQPGLPMAFPSALAFILVGLGLLLMMEPEVSPLGHLLGASVSARLVRAVLPFTMVTVGVIAWLTHLLGNSREASSAGLITAVLAVAAMFLAGFLCDRIAQVVSADLEEAERKLREAERQSRNYASRLEILN